MNVNEVDIGVTVTNSGGDFVKGLHEKDFRVFDNGIEQQLTGFLSSDDPARVVLLLECGPAALFNRNNELHAADLLLGSLSHGDTVALVTYSRTPSLILDFTGNKVEAAATLKQMNFLGGFGELNLVSSVPATLDWLATLPGKKTIVLLSSGVDSSPEANWQELQRKINTSDVRILAVSVSEEIRRSPKHQVVSAEQRQDQKYLKANFAFADQSLQRISAATGGRAYFPKSDKEFDHVYSLIARTLSREYSLAIAPSDPAGQVHQLKVKVNHPWYRVDARSAYLFPASTSN